MERTPEQREKAAAATRAYRTRQKELDLPECEVVGCSRGALPLGLCVLHYDRKRRTGSVGPAAPLLLRGVPASARFWPKVGLPTESGCWPWLGSTNAEGYGTFGGDQRKTVLAHRFAYQDCRGPIPEGMTLDHLCRNRACVNPAHLEAVTHEENVRRAVAIRTTCNRGHARCPENGYRRPGGNIYICRVCQRENKARYKAERVGAT